MLYGNFTEKRVSGWASELGVGGEDHMRPFDLPDLILCAWVWGSSCDEGCPLKPRCPCPRNSLENVKSTSLGWDRGYRSWFYSEGSLSTCQLFEDALSDICSEQPLYWLFPSPVTVLHFSATVPGITSQTGCLSPYLGVCFGGSQRNAD